MGSSETVVPGRLIQAANALDDLVGPQLDRAASSVEAAEVPGEAFSQSGLPMQVAYPGVREWGVADARSKRDELRGITDRLAATATLWAQADTDSTVVEI